MINLNLVKTEDYRFYLRNRGRNLADAYRKSTDSSIRNHFIECVTSGVLPEETIERLLPMRLNRLKVNSAEWVELNNLLFVPQNEDSNMRPGTIYLLLKDLQNGISIDKFIENRFRKCADFVDCGAEFGWYYYYMCEVFHYCVESVFCLILSQIGNMHNPSINDFFDETKHAAINELKNTRDYKNLNEWKSDCNGSITKQWSDLKKSISECNYFDAFAKAIQLILRLSNEYEDKQNAIRTFELKNKLNQQRGILSNAVQSYVLCHKDKSVDSYLDHMIKQVMNEHTMVALNKMGNSNVDLRKFIIEDGCLTLIEQRYPTETNPRINSLHSFLRDMKYISNDDTLTDVATKYLDMYGKE
jgi:hypothetical protein